MSPASSFRCGKCSPLCVCMYVCVCVCQLICLHSLCSSLEQATHWAGSRSLLGCLILRLSKATRIAATVAAATITTITAAMAMYTVLVTRKVRICFDYARSILLDIFHPLSFSFFPFFFFLSSFPPISHPLPSKKK